MKARSLILLGAAAAAALLGPVLRGAAPAATDRPPLPSTSAPPAASAPDRALRDMTEFVERLSKLKDDDVDGRLALARWARDRQLWSAAQEMADEVLYRDPGNRAAYTVLQQVDDAQPLPPDKAAEDKLKDEMLRRFGHAFQTSNTKHFVIVYDTTDAYASQRGIAMEKAYDAFQFYFNMSTLRPEFLTHRLVMILLKDREDYLAYARQTEHADMSWSAGFYSNRTNRSIFYDDTSATSNASYAKQVTDLKSQIDQFNTQIQAAAGQGQTGLVNTLTVQRNRARESLNQINAMIAGNATLQNNTRTMHEAAHQIAFNMGIQTQYTDYPFWFSEGLACSFEVEDSVGRRGPALINFGRVPPLKDALKDNKLIPLETLIKTNPDTNSSNQALGLYYAESWALFHYLYKFQRDDMEKYILAYKAHVPLRAIGTEERLNLFTQAFGKDLDALNRKWTAYLKSLPARPN